MQLVLIAVSGWMVVMASVMVLGVAADSMRPPVRTERD